MRDWPDILRVAATLASGVLPLSQMLRKFAAYPRQHELAVALREIGRVERTLFIVDWLLDADMQCRANTGLNKGEAHHALKNALRIGRQGRNPRPLERGPALPNGRAQPACRPRHPLEYRPSRRSVQTAETRRPDGRARAPGPQLTPWVGPHPGHLRIPVAKVRVAALALRSCPLPESTRRGPIGIPHPHQGASSARPHWPFGGFTMASRTRKREIAGFQEKPASSRYYVSCTLTSIKFHRGCTKNVRKNARNTGCEYALEQVLGHCPDDLPRIPAVLQYCRQ